MKPHIKKAIGNLILRFALQMVLIGLLLAAANQLYKTVTFSDVKSILDMLLTISAIVFGIVGLWLGSIYPAAITSLLNDDVSYITSTDDGVRIERLVYIIIASALVMLGALLFYLLKMIIPNIPIYSVIKDYTKIAAIAFVLYLSWHQVKCVLMLIISNLRFTSNLHSKINAGKLNHK